MPKTILALGAHYDDCPFGLPGTLLKAVKQHHRVVILSLIGDYSNWPPVKGREEALRQKTIDMAKERGIEMRFLNYASMGYEATMEAKRAVAQVVAEVQPDIAFMLWPRDRHPDHEAASAICHAALFQPARLLGKDQVRSPSEVYWYDNGPGHTIDFTPDTYFDVIDVRVPNHGEDVARLRANKILIDADLETKQRKLLQIFTQNAIGPIFFEIIQRKGNEGFGEGNFRALFESIELDQERRGVI